MNEIDRFARIVQSHAESVYREAIVNTDWSETSVVRVVTHYPEPIILNHDDKFSIDLPSYDVERYAGRAPPLSEHADGERRGSVSTITWPLLVELAEEYQQIADIVEMSASGGDHS